MRLKYRESALEKTLPLTSQPENAKFRIQLFGEECKTGEINLDHHKKDVTSETSHQEEKQEDFACFCTKDEGLKRIQPKANVTSIQTRASQIFLGMYSIQRSFLGG